MQPKPKKMRINVAGDFSLSYTKDVAPLYHIKSLPQVLQVILWNTEKFFENMSMEGRMTVCN
jgi:3-isopropylmalate/(R)-2-methylmalate dehydratase large subunit